MGTIKYGQDEGGPPSEQLAFCIQALRALHSDGPATKRGLASLAGIDRNELAELERATEPPRILRVWAQLARARGVTQDQLWSEATLAALWRPVDRRRAEKGLPALPLTRAGHVRRLAVCVRQRVAGIAVTANEAVIYVRRVCMRRKNLSSELVRVFRRYGCDELVVERGRRVDLGDIRWGELAIVEALGYLLPQDQPRSYASLFGHLVSRYAELRYHVRFLASGVIDAADRTSTVLLLAVALGIGAARQGLIDTYSSNQLQYENQNQET